MKKKEIVKMFCPACKQMVQVKEFSFALGLCQWCVDNWMLEDLAEEKGLPTLFITGEWP